MNPRILFVFAWVWIIICGFGGAADRVLADNEQKVALVMKDLFNPFFLKMEAGAKAYAEKHGIPLEVFGVERETQVDRQISIVDNLISRKYGAVVIAPTDSVKLIPACARAVSRGISVINIDNPLHSKTLASLKLKIPFIGSDNRQGGRMVGEYLIKKMGAKEGDGEIVIIEGIRGVENADLRKLGFLDAVSLDGKVRNIISGSANWHKDEAFSFMSGILQKHRKIDGIFCANDMMALGAIRALEIMDLPGKIWIGAYDNIDEARLEMHSGRMHATIEQHPELMGQFGVESAVIAMKGGVIPDYRPTPLDLITYESFGKKIGLSMADIQTHFFKTLSENARKASELFGLEFTLADADNDDALQLVALQKFIKEGVDMILVVPTNAETVSAAVEMAGKAGIPVITVDRKASREDLVLTHIASDNLLGGRMAGEFIVEKLGGRGSVLEIEGIPGTSAAHNRGAGFNQVIEAAPDIEVTAREVGGFDRAAARRLIRRLIRQGAKFDAVFAHNDEMILGAMEAYELEKKSLPAVLVGFDSIPDALSSIAAGKLTATIAQNPEEMGKIAILNAVRAFRGEKLPVFTPVALELITKGN